MSAFKKKIPENRETDGVLSMKTALNTSVSED